MKINDLRVGNLVRLKNRTDFYAIVSDIYANGGVKLTLKFKDGDSDTDTFSVEDLTPILLNRDILLGVGFEAICKGGGVTFFECICDDIYLNSESTDDFATINGDFRTIETLHDLQNFWYTQTKQELNVEKLIL